VSDGDSVDPGGLPLAKGPVRFVIGSDASLSSNGWKIWLGPDDSVYVACRDNYQDLKASLHPGVWQFGLTAEAHKRLSRNGNTIPASRHWDQWVPPVVVGPGAKVAFRLIFIHSELAVTPALRRGKGWDKPLYVEAAPGCDVTVVAVIVATNDLVLAAAGGRPTLQLARIAMKGPRYLHVVAYGDELTLPMRQWLTAAYLGSRETERLWTVPSVRMTLFGFHDDGSRFLLELSSDRPNPDPVLLVE
jgi:hypothetical protein